MVNVLVIVILFALIFGAILYMLTHVLLKKMGKEKKGHQTKHIWVWRVVIFLTLIYIFIVLWLNRNVLEEALYYGQLSFLLMAFLIIFFVTLVEVAIIYLLIPDVLKLWKRIAVEV